MMENTPEQRTVTVRLQKQFDTGPGDFILEEETYTLSTRGHPDALATWGPMEEKVMEYMARLWGEPDTAEFAGLEIVIFMA